MLGIIVVVLALAAGLYVAWPSNPTDDSVEAGFARDMAVHHSQAVEMAEAIRRRNPDPDLAFLAGDIELTQQAQIGQLGGWLDVWGLNRTSSGNAAMAWSGMNMGSTMPGMATRSEVASLTSLPLDQAEVAFLKLMIQHHRGGIHMARAALELTDDDLVTGLATSIVASQQSEIGAMTKMLEDRGASAPS